MWYHVYVLQDGYGTNLIEMNESVHHFHEYVLYKWENFRVFGKNCIFVNNVCSWQIEFSVYS